MTTTLTNQEKLNIVNQHIKSLDYALYGFELDLVQANAVSVPDLEQIASIDSKISELNSKKAALVLEKNSITE